MITSLNIRGFRGFSEFHVGGITRINLFVGANNAGKTSILEAVELLVIGTPRGLLRSPIRRGEELVSYADEPTSEVDLSHLFFGHNSTPTASFSITSDGEPRRLLECQIVAVGPDAFGNGTAQPPLLPPPEAESPLLAIHLRNNLVPVPAVVRLSPSGGIPIELRRRLLLSPTESPEQVNFLGTEMLNAGRFSQLWDSVVLKPEENSVIEALRIIEPKIDRIAFIGESRVRSGRTILLKMSNSDERIPIGTVGDGLKRLLALALNLIPAQHGFLLVDEIDTGLHFTVMEKMWQLVIEIARRLDIQVFATTHSRDCVTALAQVRERHVERADDVSLHRVEIGVDHTIAYTMDEIVIAARNHIEVR